MTIAVNGTGATGQSKTAGTTVSAGAGGTYAIGSYVFVLVALDNTGTGADGDYSQVTSVTDAGGNSYAKDIEFSNTQAAAAGGATISLWKAQLTTALSAGNLVTANHGSVTARAMGILNVTVGAGNTLAAAGTIQTRADDGADPGSLAISGLASAQHFFIRGTAYESAILTLTKTASFDASNGVATSGGGGATNMGVAFEWLVATNTGATSDIGLSATSDNASVLAGYVEVSTGTTVNPSSGHLILAGHLPTVTKLFNITPSAGHLTLGGKIAPVSTTFNITPSVGHLVLAGHASSVLVGASVTPTTGHLTLGGHLPTVTLQVNVAPATGHLTLSGKIATVSKAFNFSPSTGHLTLGGKVPISTLTVNISPATGHLVLTGYVPDVSGTTATPTGFPLKVTYRHRGRNC